MAADTIDSLQIELSAHATRANKAIESLVGRLDRLSTSLNKIDGSKLTGLANGVQRLGSSMQAMSAIKTSDFTRLARNLEKIGNVNVSSLNSAASSMSHLTRALGNLGTSTQSAQTVGDMAKNIAKLGNKSVQTAITNIPKLATALEGLITTLSKSPKISQNVIQLTNSIANLASQGAKVGSASNSIVKGLNNTVKSSDRAQRSFKGLAAAFGKFYATYFLLIRGIKGLFQSIESTADYIEAYNYFNVAFGKIASEWSNDWEKYGYENAQVYAESFTERMNKTLGKMSGLRIQTDESGSGLLSESGMKNLGLNIQEITQYASQLASVTNSIGQTGEVSLAAAKSMTMLAGDISSLFNIDYSSVANNLQSGLIGQSRALYKYGIDITNATLQTYAYELGLEKAVMEMTQAEKMQLRMLAILDQSKVSWGDLANTINSPSNMLRQFTNNLKETSMVLGQIFIPILQKVMPVVNGVVIAIKRLLVNIAALLGIKIDFGAFGQGYSDMEDGLEDVSSGFDDVADSAKKAQAGIRAFDELNVINMPDTSGSGSGTGSGGSIDLTDEILEATEEYEKVWNEAFENMENKAEEFADKISKALEPVLDIFEDLFSGDFFGAGQDVSNLVIGITDFFAEAIDNVDWNGIGKKIGDFFAGIDWFGILKSVGNLIWQALKAAFELYVGAFSTAPLETAVVSLVAMPKLLKAITASKFVTGFKKLAGNAKLVATSLSGNKDSVKVLTTNYPKLGKSVDTVRKAFANFRFGIENGNFATGINAGIKTIRDNLTGLQKGVITAVAGFAEFSIVSSTFEGLVNGSENLVSGIGKIGAAAGLASAAMYTAFGPAGIALAAITGVVAAVKGINDAFDEIRAEEIGNVIKEAMTNPGGTPLSEITSGFATAFSEAASGFDVISEKSSEMDSVQKNIEDTWTEIYKIQEAMENGVLSVEEGKAQLDTLFSELATLTEQKFSSISSALLSVYGEGGALSSAYERIGAETEGFVDTVINAEYTNTEAAKAIIEEMNGLPPTSERYKELQEQLAMLSGEMQDFLSAASDFTYDMNALEGEVDYRELFPDGETLKTEVLQGYLDEAATSLESYKDSLDDAGKDIAQYWQSIINSPATSEEDRAIAQAALDYLPTAIGLMKVEAESQVVEFTDMMQNDFIARTNEIIDKSVEEWENKKWYEQWWNSIWGADNEAEYVKEAVDQQQKNIDELSKAIESSLGDLEMDGVAWASEAAEEIYGALFDVEASGSYKDLTGDRIYTLNNEYKEIINGATKDIAGLARERSKEAVEGYAKGLSENDEVATSAATTFIDKVMDAIKEAQDSHSPSKVTKGLGKDAADGYGLGIEENQDSTITKVKAYINGIMKSFSGMANSLRQIGVESMNGLYNGMASMENPLYKKAERIADNIADTLKKALDIHSPSRVMFKLGDYTMQGFQNGLENLYQPILTSVKEFGNDLQVAPTPGLESMYNNIQYAYGNSYMPSGAGYYGESQGQENAETNALLREQNELLRALLEKPVLENGDVFRAARAGYKQEANRLGARGNPSVVWG